jgi:hypothetical protein
MLSVPWTKKNEAAETVSTRATRHIENGNNSRRALGTPAKNQRLNFLGLYQRRNQVTPYLGQTHIINEEAARVAGQLQRQGEVGQFLARYAQLLQEKNSPNPALFRASLQTAMRMLATEYKMTPEVADRVVGILKKTASGELSPHQKETLRDIYDQMRGEHAAVIVQFHEIYPNAPSVSLEEELLRISEEAMVSTLPVGNPVPPPSLASLSPDQVQQLTNTYETTLRKYKDPVKASDATFASFKLKNPTVDTKHIEEAIWQISIQSNELAPPPPADMPPVEAEKEQILREIYSGLLASSPDADHARQQALASFMDMFEDIRGDEDYLVRVLLSDTLRPVENPAGNGERWTRLFNNCAEKAVAELAKRSGREVPQFNYAAGPDEPIWDEQIQFGNYVSYLNLQKDIPIHQHQIDNPRLERVLEGGLAQDLLDKLEEGGQEKVYVMRSGFNGGAGHFQLTYFDNERNRWVVDRPKPYAPLDVTDDNGELSEECRSRFIDRNQRYALYLDELDPEKIEQYAQFIVRCRDLKDEFAL